MPHLTPEQKQKTRELFEQVHNGEPIKGRKFYLIQDCEWDTLNFLSLVIVITNNAAWALVAIAACVCWYQPEEKYRGIPLCIFAAVLVIAASFTAGCRVAMVQRIKAEYRG